MNARLTRSRTALAGVSILGMLLLAGCGDGQIDSAEGGEDCRNRQHVGEDPG